MPFRTSNPIRELRDRRRMAERREATAVRLSQFRLSMSISRIFSLCRELLPASFRKPVIGPTSRIPAAFAKFLLSADGFPAFAQGDIEGDRATFVPPTPRSPVAPADLNREAEPALRRLPRREATPGSAPGPFTLLQRHGGSASVADRGRSFDGQKLLDQKGTVPLQSFPIIPGVREHPGLGRRPPTSVHQHPLD